MKNEVDMVKMRPLRYMYGVKENIKLKLLLSQVIRGSSKYEWMLKKNEDQN